MRISSGTLKINAVLVSPVEHRPSPPPPGPVGVARERRGIAAELSKRGASKVALPGTGCSVPSTGGEVREEEGSKIGSEVFSSRLVLLCPPFHFPLGLKAFPYEHGTLAPPTGVVNIIWGHHVLLRVHEVCHGKLAYLMGYMRPRDISWDAPWAPWPMPWASWPIPWDSWPIPWGSP